MNNVLRGIACLLLFAPSTLAAQDLSGLYDRATLEQWRPRYERSTTRIFEQVILPHLRPQERQRLGGVRLDFRLYAEGTARTHPLQFYAPDASRVVLPIASLKFLDDLCTAYAWLHIHGYGLETISEYIAMLRYGSFPSGRHPRPLEALHIPRNALDDPRVDELALGHFVTARTFILLHELGHVLYNHQRSSTPNETEADRFAATVMRRTPLPPLGMVVFFIFDAHWSNSEATHPLSGRRLKALATQVDDRSLAIALDSLGSLVDDRDTRASFVTTGRATSPATLRPRRPRELPRLPAADPAPGSRLAFHGRYRGQSAQLSEPGAFPVEVTFQRRDDQVRGQYSFGLGVGTLEGRVTGETLFFEWTWAGDFGRGVFRANPDGSGFTGTWGYRESADNGGTWNGRRIN